MRAKSIKGKSTQQITDAFQKSLEDGFCPTLAIAFISKDLDQNAIQTLFTEANIDLFGATTNGEFTDEEPQTKSAAILLLDINRDYYKIFIEDFRNDNYRETAKQLAQKAKEAFPEVGFLLATSHSTTDGEEILLGLQEITGADVNAFGGAAGDDYSFTDTCIFTNGRESSKGVIALAIDERKVRLKGVATCGWKAVGTEKIVTKSEGNHVYTIDHIPALDITVKFGGIENPTPENDNLLLEMASNFPLQLQREKGDPVMRPGLIVDWSDRSFFTSGTVPQGSIVRFSLPPDWDVMEKVVREVQNLKDTEMPEADALVVFSCAGRILSLGPLMSEELEGIKKVWNVPMAGMFSNAELARATGGNLEMHNLTTACVALKEL